MISDYANEPFKNQEAICDGTNVDLFLVNQYDQQTFISNIGDRIFIFAGRRTWQNLS